MKSNEFKKRTFEDRFDRKYACWVKNNRKAWHYWKRRNRRQYRQMLKKDLKKDLKDLEEGRILC